MPLLSPAASIRNSLDEQLSTGGRAVRKRARWLPAATANTIAELAGIGMTPERGR